MVSYAYMAMHVPLHFERGKNPMRGSWGGEGGGDPTFAPATIAPAMISPTTKSYIVRVIIGF